MHLMGHHWWYEPSLWSLLSCAVHMLLSLHGCILDEGHDPSDPWASSAAPMTYKTLPASPPAGPEHTLVHGVTLPRVRVQLRPWRVSSQPARSLLAPCSALSGAIVLSCMGSSAGWAWGMSVPPESVRPHVIPWSFTCWSTWSKHAAHPLNSRLPPPFPECIMRAATTGSC